MRQICEMRGKYNNCENGQGECVTRTRDIHTNSEISFNRSIEL